MPVRVSNVRSSSTSSTPTLSQGSQGGAVVDLQQKLDAAGFNVGAADGDFGPHTKAAVVAFQHAHGLTADGVVGPKTWAALRGAAPSAPARPAAPTAPTAPTGGSTPLRQRMLALAQSQVGTAEATNNNDGAVLKYPRSFGRGSEAWCADFMSWVSTNSGKPMNIPYCPNVEAHAKATGNWKGKNNPQPGDFVLFDWNHDGVADHIGMVKTVNRDGTIGTIEGNTSNPRTGKEGVWERTRTMSTVLGFVNP
jgi:peptidoglycan hydrolase-like protein with peptidoglycan-binding domain